MRPWAATALLLLATLVGCGDDEAGDDDGEATAPADPARFDSECADPVAQAADADLELVATATGELVTGQEVGWRLVVSNRSADPVTLVFPSGQVGDVELVREGEAVWQWSDGRMFTQAIRCAEIAAGRAVFFELEPMTLTVESGDYEQRASLAASPAPPDATESVTVEE